MKADRPLTSRLSSELLLSNLKPRISYLKSSQSPLSLLEVGDGGRGSWPRAKLIDGAAATGVSVHRAKRRRVGKRRREREGAMASSFLSPELSKNVTATRHRTHQSQVGSAPAYEYDPPPPFTNEGKPLFGHPGPAPPRPFLATAPSLEVSAVEAATPWQRPPGGNKLTACSALASLPSAQL